MAGRIIDRDIEFYMACVENAEFDMRRAYPDEEYRSAALLSQYRAVHASLVALRDSLTLLEKTRGA